MQTRRWLPLLLLMTVLMFGRAGFAEDQQPQPPGDDTEAAALPEHRVRPLPSDTFKPSEDISEDFPVPFPVDI